MSKQIPRNFKIFPKSYSKWSIQDPNLILSDAIVTALNHRALLAQLRVWLYCTGAYAGHTVGRTTRPQLLVFITLCDLLSRAVA